MQDTACHVGKPEIAAAIAVSELLMVDAEQIKYGRVDVMDMHRFFDGLETEIVSRAVDRAALHGAAGEPHGESEWIVVAAPLDTAARAAPFANRRPAELRPANYQRILPHPAALQVFHNGRKALVGILRIRLVRENIAVRVPRIALGVVHLHHADSALDEAFVLTEHAAQVTVFHRGPQLTAQRALRERAEATGKVEIVLATVVEEILGENAVSGVRVKDVQSGATRDVPVKAVFVYVGLEPNTAFLRGVLALDAVGHIETDIMMRTSLAGVFAAGDIRQHSVAQLAAAAGDGATAATAAARYILSSRG